MGVATRPLLDLLGEKPAARSEIEAKEVIIYGVVLLVILLEGEVRIYDKSQGDDDREYGSVFDSHSLYGNLKGGRKRRGDVGYLKEWVLIKYSMILGASERV